MKDRVEKPEMNKSRAIASTDAQSESSKHEMGRFIDCRPQTLTQSRVASKEIKGASRTNKFNSLQRLILQNHGLGKHSSSNPKENSTQVTQLVIGIHNPPHDHNKELTPLAARTELAQTHPQLIGPQVQVAINAINAANPIYRTWDEFVGAVKSEMHVKAMENMVGPGAFTWGHPAIPGMTHVGMEKAKPFSQWVYGKTTTLPNIMNCWESVLYAAFNAGLISMEGIRVRLKINPSFEGPDFINRIRANSTMQIDGSDTGPPIIPTTIPRGQVVIFGRTSQHVSLSTGVTTNSNSHEVLELDVPTGGVVKTSAEAIMARNAAYGRGICWGDLP